MKRIVAAFLIVGFASSFAFAGSQAEFKDDYIKKGLDVAVENAMKDGAGPDVIVEQGLAIENVNPQNLIQALYCSGVSGQDVSGAAQKANVSELIVSAAFKKSLEQCGDKVADAQAYTRGGRQGRGFGGPNRGQRGRPFASPSKF